MTHKVVIDNNSITNIKKMINSNMNYIIVKDFSSNMCTRVVVKTNVGTVEIISNTLYCEKFDEDSVIKVTENKDSNYGIDGNKVKTITLNKIIEDIYIIKDVVKIKHNNDICCIEQDIGIVFQLIDNSIDTIETENKKDIECLKNSNIFLKTIRKNC